MNFQDNERIFSSRLFRYLSRIVILYIFSTIFKSFDNTFIYNLKIFGFRGQVFSLVFIFYGLLVWEGAVLLSGWVEKKLKHRAASMRLLLLIGSLMVYGLLAAYGFGFTYGGMDIVLFHRYEAWQSFLDVTYDLNFGVFLFYVLILAFTGITFYYKRWKEYQLQAERLMRENIQAQYEALRNQVDPHFFFNSLSVLTNLVYKSPDLSAEYITQLAKTYRYILDKKFENLVTIQTELDFLQSYLFLIRIRHQSSISFEADISDATKAKGMIPPATLQMLVENAIKHNRFSVNDPLAIRIKEEQGQLVVTNPVRKKANPESISGIGLENIRKRYVLMSEKEITIDPGGEYFTVKLPVITPV